MLKKYSNNTEGCFTSTITNYIDEKGNLINSTQSQWTEIPCGNAPDGTRVIKAMIVQVKKIEDIN
jgi:hypothetical protein